jgi:hypothetical protein
MADLPKYKPDGVTQTRVTRLTGWFVATAGSITAQAGVSTATSGGQLCGVTWARTGAGIFRATIHRGYKRFIRGDAQLVTTAIDTAPVAAAAVAAANFTLSTSGLATGATPVPATAGIGIVSTNAAGAITDPTNPVLITYDIELADI